MKQPNLFSAPPRARLTDPISSHIAADRAQASGRIGRQQAEARRLVLRWPGLTAKALAQAAEPLDELARLRLYDRLKRRLSEVAHGVRNPEGVRWYPRRLGPEEIRDGRLT